MASSSFEPTRIFTASESGNADVAAALTLTAAFHELSQARTLFRRGGQLNFVTVASSTDFSFVCTTIRARCSACGS